jgi:hypothetical protein
MPLQYAARMPVLISTCTGEQGKRNAAAAPTAVAAAAAAAASLNARENGSSNGRKGKTQMG